MNYLHSATHAKWSSWLFIHTLFHYRECDNHTLFHYRECDKSRYWEYWSERSKYRFRTAYI